MPYFEATNIADYYNILFEIEFYLRRHHHVILSGIAGIGKTTILRAFEKDYKDKYDLIRFINAYELTTEDLEFYFQGDMFTRHILLIIDGYDSIVDKGVLESMAKVFREGRKNGVRILASTRQSEINAAFESNAAILQLRPFTPSDARRYLLDAISLRKLKFPDMGELENILSLLPKTPRELLQLIEWGDKIPLHKIMQSLRSEADYINPLFNGASLIIQPEQKSIITNARVIQQTLLDRVGNNMADILRLSSRDFERLVAEVFEKNGFKVELTQETRDNGKDIILTLDNITGKSLYYVECKRYAPGRKVSVGVIQRLHGTVQTDKATKGIVVTTSSFSNPAIREVKKIEHQISLMDHVVLYQTITKLITPG